MPDVDVAGDPVRRVPHLLTFSALYVDGETLTLELDKAGFAVASGSACSASSEHPSHVLAAMGALTHGNVRIGLTWTTAAGRSSVSGRSAADRRKDPRDCGRVVNEARHLSGVVAGLSRNEMPATNHRGGAPYR